MIEPGSPEFPAAKEDDDDDVAWALSTAAVQWKRGSRADAVVWLRRAVDSAVSVGATWRAAELTRQTDVLEAYLVDGPEAPTPIIHEGRADDDFDGTDMIDDEALSLPPDAEFSEPPGALAALSADSTDETTDITPDGEEPIAADDDVEEISDDEIADDEIADDEIADDEIAAEDEADPLPRFASEAPTGIVRQPGSARAGAGSGAALLDAVALEAEAAHDEEPDTVSEPEPHYAEEPAAPQPFRLSAPDALELDDELESSPITEVDPEPPPSAAESALDAALGISSEPELVVEPAPAEPYVAGVLLSEIRGFEDFPPETQLALARAARVERLATEEEVGGFGLALVLRGAVSVMPAIADLACGAAGERELIFGRGSLEEGVALRLVATAPDTQIAVWDFAAIEPALADCPWVLEELQGVADKYQALAGVAMGPMGDRLDDSLRDMVLSRCSLVRLLPGEVLVERGKPVGGLFIVGAGRIELGNDAASAGSEGELGPGDFLFAPQVLAAGAAPTAARAGATGALLMAADRHAAHELMVSVPPLLELLAG